MPEMPTTMNLPLEEVIWDKLAVAKGKYAQAPTKILETSSGGQLWLSGLPTVANRGHQPLCGSHASPKNLKGAKKKNPSQAFLRRFPIAVRAARTEAWRELWPLLLQSLYCGEIVVVHCMSGRHRAARAAALTRAIMMDESFDTAAEWIAERCNIDIPGLCRDKELDRWLKVTAGNTQRRDRWPRTTGLVSWMCGQMPGVVGAQRCGF